MSNKSLPSHDLVAEVSHQHEQIGILKKKTDSFSPTSHPEARWFANAGLGLFIHWGLSAVEGEGDLSWSMMARDPDSREDCATRYGAPAVQKTYTPEAYWKQAERFNPRHYAPDKWLAAARRAGFRYAALTTKHHDGYTLWPSKFGNLGTHTHMGGRDLIGEFVEACRANDLKVGLYYSPPDWFYEKERMSFRFSGGKPDLDTRHQPVILTRQAIDKDPGPDIEEHRQYAEGFRRHLRGQIEELLTRYGKIDLLWFDGYGHDSISVERIRELQPGIVITPRAHGYGDFQTFECCFPKEQPIGWWEYCHLWADGGWAYLKHEIYKPTGWMLSEYSKTRAWGGNFLPSVGPNADGELPAAAYRRLAELEAWMKHSGVSVHDVEPGPLDQCNVPVTRKGNVWFLHALLTSPNAIELQRVAAPQGVTLLRTGAKLPWTHEGRSLKIEIPTDLRTTDVDVVQVVFGQP